ncbi:MAG TPA: hypothetical protein VG369_09290 [Humibacter sp.]|nr:hypothetical protein [Humibacter sp.]
MSWHLTDLNQEYGFPGGVETPASYLFPAESTRHVIYLAGSGYADAQGDYHELYCGADLVWHEKNLMSEAGAPQASTPPRAYLFTDEGSQHVVYLDRTTSGHIRELYQDDGWHPNDLTDAAGAPTARLTPSGFDFVTGDTQHVVYLGLDAHVHLLSRAHAGPDPTWTHKDLTHDVGGPTSALAPAGHAFEPGRSIHVDFVDVHGGIWEYTRDPNLNWSVAPVAAGVAPAPVTNGLHGYTFVGEGTRHIAFRTENGDVWSLSYDGDWHADNLTVDLGAAKSAAGTEPWGYVFESAPQVPVATEHIVYTGADSLVHEFWRDPGGWHENPLTSTASPVCGDWGPSGFADPSTSSQSVFYLSADNHVVELHYTPGPAVRPVGPVRFVRARL